MGGPSKFKSGLTKASLGAQIDQGHKKTAAAAAQHLSKKPTGLEDDPNK